MKGVDVEIRYIYGIDKQYTPDVFRRFDELLRVLFRVPLNLKRAGTTLAAESLASNVITQAATTINPVIKWISLNPLWVSPIYCFIHLLPISQIIYEIIYRISF